MAAIPGRREAARGEKWTKEEARVFDTLASPDRIQAFLDGIEYSADPIYRSPRSVLRDRKAHCFDGALFAAAALERLGHPPLLMDLRAYRDDDHIVAVFRRHGHFGAVAKSNFVGLRFREPIFRTLRELALSYFPAYYNLDGEMSLREYSVPLDLRRHDPLHWRTSDDRLEEIATHLDRIRHYPLMTPDMIASLAPIDRRSYEAGMLGTNMAGVYVPAEHDQDSRGPGSNRGG